MSGHTPGPWRIGWKEEWSDEANDMVERHKWAERIVSGGVEKYDGVTVAGTCDGCNLIAAADARLIAAAPDMLEALEAVERHIRSGATLSMWDMRDCLSAIAKAKGGGK